MKSFDHLNRRIHLYLGLFLLPWLCMYGVSSFMISHPDWFAAVRISNMAAGIRKGLLAEDPGGRGDPPRCARDSQRRGLEGAFWVQRPNAREIRINRFRFRNEIRLIYSISDHRLRAERQQFGWNRLAVRLHFRGGFLQPTFFDDLWAVLVDVVCVGILIWITSGMVMWWRVARLRLWGSVALVGGVTSFVIFAWRL